MDQPRRRAATLWLLLLLAVGYLGLIRTLAPLTGSHVLDGVLGVGLGLYICSHPAAAAIDLFYLDRLVLQQLASDWPDLRWVALNAVVLVAGILVTIAGATRLVG